MMMHFFKADQFTYMFRAHTRMTFLGLLALVFAFLSLFLIYFCFRFLYFPDVPELELDDKKINAIEIAVYPKYQRDLLHYPVIVSAKKKVVIEEKEVPEFIELRGYIIRAFVPAGNQVKAFVEGPSGASYYINVGYALNGYRVIKISSKEVSLVKKNIEGSPKDLLLDKKVTKYLILKR